MRKLLELLIDGAVKVLTVRKCYICEFFFFDCFVGMTVVDLSWYGLCVLKHRLWLLFIIRFCYLMGSFHLTANS